MNQMEFIYMSNLAEPKCGVNQTENGVTECHLRDGILITHDYKRRDLMLLYMEEFKVTFIIPSRLELQEIFRMHSDMDYITMPLYEYALKTLKEYKK